MGNRPNKQLSHSQSDSGGLRNGLEPDDRQKKGGKTKSNGRKALDETDGDRARPVVRTRSKSVPSEPNPDGTRGKGKVTVPMPSSNGGGGADKGSSGVKDEGSERGLSGGGQLEVKIYRSYSNLADGRHISLRQDTLDTSNIKVRILYNKPTGLVFMLII